MKEAMATASDVEHNYCQHLQKDWLLPAQHGRGSLSCKPQAKRLWRNCSCCVGALKKRGGVGKCLSQRSVGEGIAQDVWGGVGVAARKHSSLESSHPASGCYGVRVIDLHHDGKAEMPSMMLQSKELPR